MIWGLMPVTRIIESRLIQEFCTKGLGNVRNGPFDESDFAALQNNALDIAG